MAKPTYLETQPLLGDDAFEPEYGTERSNAEMLPSTHWNGKYSFDSGDDTDDEDADLKKKRAQRLEETGGWIGYIKDFGLFVPYLVPRSNVKVQLCIGVCLLALAGRRVLNIMVPHQLGIIAAKLLDHTPPYRELLVCFFLGLLNDNSGLGMIEELAKIPIKQFSEREITNAAFKHVLSLSMDFHSERDSAEVMKALEQGTSLTLLLETLVCESLPTIMDVTIALGIFYWKFDPYIALVMFVSCSTFFGLEIVTSRWKVEPRRQSAKAERQAARVMHQAIQGWTTVSYFNIFSFEIGRFGNTIETKLSAFRKWGIRDTCIQGVVELLLPVSFFILAGMVVRNISVGLSEPGDFVFFIQYWDYLFWPLKWLSYEYRKIMSHLIDAERLLALFQQRPTVVDREGAHVLNAFSGDVAFEDVFFAYDERKTTLRDINFSVPPGQTVALVGATGAGKSTITKLLLRFYDVTGGRITVDSHDIRDITLDSLRNLIGVVPQDPMLFNGTILQNLRYANPTATFAEIIDACKAAAINEKILAFSDGYKTRVGEQGVKLSGGEVQRLAVARVILKDPSILILDEATSAIDTHTESNIQRALDAFKQRRKRITFVIAHRLSTIVNAEMILVFDEGKIVERGTHTELIKANSLYKRLWSKQSGAGLEHII